MRRSIAFLAALLSVEAFISPLPHTFGGSRSKGMIRQRNVLQMAADFYQTLGVSRSADVKELKTAYRKLARMYHPDVNPTGEEKFKEISRAYDVLSNPETRQRYDQFGEDGLRGSGSGGMGGGGAEVDLSDIFDSFFGGGRGRTQQRRGPVAGDDLRVDLDLDFARAVFGGEEKVRIRHLVSCQTCTGSGVKPGAKTSTCRTCRGQGVVTQIQRTPLGAFQTQTTCPQCSGSGKEVEAYCNSCAGRGLVEETKQVKVNIPAGVDTGNKLRVKGEGDAGAKGAPAGDLYVFVNAKPHPTLTRSGTDISSKVAISYIDALLGNESVIVEVVDGEVEIKVPPGSQPDTVLRIKGKGAPQLGGKGTRGDHFVNLNVQIPKEISEEERALLEQLRKMTKSGGKTEKKKPGFGSFFK